MRWTIRRSKNRNMTSWDNMWCLTLRNYYTSSRSTNRTSSNILTQRNTWMRGRNGCQKCVRRSRNRGWRDMWRDISGIPYGHSSWFWYPHMTTNTRSRTDMWGSLHHRDGRCNVTSAPKHLHMERNRSALRNIFRFNLWLGMMCRIMCKDIRHAIMNITSSCGFIVSLLT